MRRIHSCIPLIGEKEETGREKKRSRKKEKKVRSLHSSDLV